MPRAPFRHWYLKTNCVYVVRRKSGLAGTHTLSNSWKNAYAPFSFFLRPFFTRRNGAMALSRKLIIFIDKSLGRKELGGIYPKVLQVEHFPDIHGVTCPKKVSSESPPPVAPFSTPFLAASNHRVRGWLGQICPPLTAGMKNHIKTSNYLLKVNKRTFWKTFFANPRKLFGGLGPPTSNYNSRSRRS